MRAENECEKNEINHLYNNTEMMIKQVHQYFDKKDVFYVLLRYISILYSTKRKFIVT